VAKWCIRNPQSYSSSFASSQQRLSQMSHATLVASSQPTVCKTATTDVAPGHYKVSPGANSAISDPGGQVDTDDDQLSRGRATMAARTAFTSTTPQMLRRDMQPHELHVNHETSTAFERSGARELGPGSYSPTNGAVEQWSSVGAGHRSSFSSRRLQRTSSWHGRTWQPATFETSAEPASMERVERSLRRTVPSSRGHTWSPTPRKSPGDGAYRDPGLDQFYDPKNGTIEWRLIEGLHDPPVQTRAKTPSPSNRR